MDERIVDACAMQFGAKSVAVRCHRHHQPIRRHSFRRNCRTGGRTGDGAGANVGEGAAIFEAVHGSAPDIAGKGVANPLALMLAAAMMLDHVGRQDLAARLRKAIDRMLNEDGIRTKDLGGNASTSEFVDALIRRIQAD